MGSGEEGYIFGKPIILYPDSIWNNEKNASWQVSACENTREYWFFENSLKAAIFQY